MSTSPQPEREPAQQEPSHQEIPAYQPHGEAVGQPTNWAQRLRRWVWNFFAVVGISSLLCIGLGLSYGYFTYRDAGPRELSSGDNPLTGELGKNSNIGLKLPSEFVEARLTPIPPLQSGALIFSSLSVANPVEKVMIFANPTEEEIEGYNRSAVAWLEETPDYDYECDETPNAKQWYGENKAMEGEVSTLVVCERTLNENEQRIAQTPRGYVSFYSFKRGESLIYMQFMVGARSADEASLRTRSLLEGFTWN